MKSRVTRWRFSSIVSLLLLGSALVVSGQDVYLCVWRNPERTMTRIFPDAKDYLTKTVKITPQQLATIEKTTGMAVLPGQRDVFSYYTMTGVKGEEVGTIVAVTQKGEFGAIEFVVGVDTRGVIKGLYVQRTREPDTRFKQREFLDLFVGRNSSDALSFKSLYKGPKSAGTEAVTRGLIKDMVSLRVLRGGGGE